MPAELTSSPEGRGPRTQMGRRAAGTKSPELTMRPPATLPRPMPLGTLLAPVAATPPPAPAAPALTHARQRLVHAGGRLALAQEQHRRLVLLNRTGQGLERERGAGGGLQVDYLGAKALGHVAHPGALRGAGAGRGPVLERWQVERVLKRGTPGCASQPSCG